MNGIPVQIQAVAAWLIDRNGNMDEESDVR